MTEVSAIAVPAPCDVPRSQVDSRLRRGAYRRMSDWMTVPQSVVQMLSVTMMLGAFACPCHAECIQIWKDIPDAKRLAALVFSGTVIERKPDPDGLFVTFAVDRVWKGPRLRRLVLLLN